MKKYLNDVWFHSCLRACWIHQESPPGHFTVWWYTGCFLTGHYCTSCWDPACWCLLYLPWSQDSSPCKHRSRTLSLAPQMSKQSPKMSDWFPLQDRAVGKSCLQFRRFIDRPLEKLRCKTQSALWGWLLEDLLSDFMDSSLWVTEINPLKRREYNNKYRNIGRLNEKYVLEMH